MKIYVASSWRNKYHAGVIDRLRQDKDHDVFDYRATGVCFHWSDIDPNWQQWTCQQYIDGLQHPIAVKGFHRDLLGMEKADACVLVLPSGNSAHTEAGWMQGQGKPVFVFMPEAGEPELMRAIFIGGIYTTIESLLVALTKWERQGR